MLNEGRDLVEITVTDIATLHSQRYCKLKIFGVCISHGTRTWTTHDESTDSRTYSSLFGTIEAGVALNANVTGYLSNNAVRGGVGQVGLSSGTPVIETASLPGAAGASTAIGSVGSSTTVTSAALAPPAPAPACRSTGSPSASTR